MGWCMPKTLGERIREIRESRGLNRKELAERAHVDRTYVGKIERGERVNVAPEILDAIATALDYPLFDLLADIGLGQQLTKQETEDWRRILIRAFEALPPDLRDSQLRVLLLLEEQVKRQQAERPARESPDREARSGEEA